MLEKPTLAWDAVAASTFKIEFAMQQLATIDDQANVNSDNSAPPVEHRSDPVETTDMDNSDLSERDHPVLREHRKAQESRMATLREQKLAAEIQQLLDFDHVADDLTETISDKAHRVLRQGMDSIDAGTPSDAFLQWISMCIHIRLEAGEDITFDQAFRLAAIEPRRRGRPRNASKELAVAKAYQFSIRLATQTYTLDPTKTIAIGSRPITQDILVQAEAAAYAAYYGRSVESAVDDGFDVPKRLEDTIKPILKTHSSYIAISSVKQPD